MNEWMNDGEEERRGRKKKEKKNEKPTFSDLKSNVQKEPRQKIFREKGMMIG